MTTDTPVAPTPKLVVSMTGGLSTDNEKDADAELTSFDTDTVTACGEPTASGDSHTIAPLSGSMAIPDGAVASAQVTGRSPACRRGKNVTGRDFDMTIMPAGREPLSNTTTARTKNDRNTVA